METKHQINIWYVVFAFLALMLFQSWWQQQTQVEIIPYSEFERYLEQDIISEVEISTDTIRGHLKQPVDGKSQFLTTRVEPDMVERLEQANISYTGIRQNTFITNVLSWVLPVVLFFAIWSFLIRRLAERQGGLGGLMTIGKSNAKVYVETDTKVSFADVAGVDEAKTELREIVEFLRSPQDYGKLGAHVPKGVLLMGPPGTGKTLLARAVAGEAKVPFYSINGSEFVEMFVGVGAARVRDLFVQARSHAPAIIFIDELDALGRARGATPGVGGHDEREQTLNQLLSELDGFDPTTGLVLLAATNRPEILDPALLRAGRFDRQVLVDRPDREGRFAILKVHAQKIVQAPDMDLKQVAALTTGFTGADLANLVNEAATIATRRRANAVTLADFTNALERITAGLEKRNRLLNPLERNVVAYHEMGHALTALALPGTDVVHKISIIPRGIGSLGYTIQRPTEDRYLMTQDELQNKIAVLMGGRAAEVLIFGKLSTGAADDLAKATDIARAMVARYGMNEELGYAIYDKERGSFLGQQTEVPMEMRSYSEETARELDTAVRSVLQQAFNASRRILEMNRDVLEQCARSLLEKETLEEDVLKEMTRGLKKAE